MKYLCLVYQDERKLNSLSAREYDALIEEMLAYDHEMQRSGHSLCSTALGLVDTVSTIRVRGTIVDVTDGSCAVKHGSEQLGGYILIEARDLNEAIRVASKIPSACMGRVEVRRVKDAHYR